MLDQKKLSQAYKAAKQLTALVESIDNRAMATDGPVPPTLEEATAQEKAWLDEFIRKIGRAA